jgi:hypothetical protein
MVHSLSYGKRYYSILQIERNGAPSENRICLGVAQVVECLIWSQEVAGSSPVTQTKIPGSKEFRVVHPIGKIG